MKIQRHIIVFDAADIEAESAFWAGVFGGEVERPADDWHSIIVDGKYVMAVQLAPDHVQPDWPDGTPQQIHLDLHIDSLASSHDKVMGLGAKLLEPAEDAAAEEGFQVYADPAGHPFCLCWHRPESE